MNSFDVFFIKGFTVSQTKRLVKVLNLGISDQEVSKGFKFWYLRPRG